MSSSRLRETAELNSGYTGPNLMLGSDPHSDRSGPTSRAAQWFGGVFWEEHNLDKTGEPPDPRFTFANERTFLAWNRTALALIAGGLGAAQFLNFGVHGLRLLIAIPLIALGAVLSVASYRHWIQSERAMRMGRPVEYSVMPRVLTSGIAIVAVFGAILAVADRIVH